ncbi:hypothetical protein BSKO_01005 [Bryopsis sp. KO-2023]|nr:hypothetical protein BSKO_01005 [Bryopsis sp. KO-2023]
MAAFTSQSSNLRATSFVGGPLRVSGPSAARVTRERGTTPVRMAQQLQGTVVSTKMEKTIVVSVLREVPHPQYTKRVRQTNKFLAHDEEETAEEGDYVRIVPTRPISKRKRFAVAEIIRKAS